MRGFDRSALLTFKVGVELSLYDGLPVRRRQPLSAATFIGGLEVRRTFPGNHVSISDENFVNLLSPVDNGYRPSQWREVDLVRINSH